MNEIIKRIFNHPATNKKAGASMQDISAFESETGVTLPTGYKEWLALTDGGEIFKPGVVFLGVADKTHPKLLIRRGNGAEAPDTLIVIGRTAYGDAVCFKEGTEQIIQWDHESNDEFLSWNSFSEYLEYAEEIYSDES